MLKSIEELHKKDKLASMNGDLETLLTLFTDDGIAIPAEGEIIEGKEALRDILKQTFELHQDYIITEYNQDFKEVKILGKWRLARPRWQTVWSQMTASSSVGWAWLCTVWGHIRTPLRH
jgi:uncharacterized protein (TIGR02246 family)